MQNKEKPLVRPDHTNFVVSKKKKKGMEEQMVESATVSYGVSDASSSSIFEADFKALVI